jgi:hypothetical protein
MPRKEVAVVQNRLATKKHKKHKMKGVQGSRPFLVPLFGSSFVFLLILLLCIPLFVPFVPLCGSIVPLCLFVAQNNRAMLLRSIARLVKG